MIKLLELLVPVRTCFVDIIVPPHKNWYDSLLKIAATKGHSPLSVSFPAIICGKTNSTVPHSIELVLQSFD